jgi:hypothetical protein
LISLIFSYFKASPGLNNAVVVALLAKKGDLLHASKTNPDKLWLETDKVAFCIILVAGEVMVGSLCKKYRILVHGTCDQCSSIWVHREVLLLLVLKK